MQKKSSILAIGGIDPCSGAGLNVDIQVIANLNLHPLTIPTILTAQNPTNISAIQIVDEAFLYKQIISLKKYNFNTIKLSLFADEQINFISNFLQEKKSLRIIYDSILKATEGRTFISPKYYSKIKEKILPYTDYFCPNFNELEQLFSQEINNTQDIYDLAQNIYKKYNTKLYLKGGHKQFGTKLYDYFFDGKQLLSLYTKKYDDQNTHGSGCRFATSLACYLNIYNDEITAIKQAKNYISNCFFSRENISKNLQHLSIPKELTQHPIEIKMIC